MPHNQSLTDPHHTMWLPPSQTQAKVKGSRNQKRARLATSICCHSYQDFPQYWLSVKGKKY